MQSTMSRQSSGSRGTLFDEPDAQLVSIRTSNTTGSEARYPDDASQPLLSASTSVMHNERQGSSMASPFEEAIAHQISASNDRHDARLQTASISPSPQRRGTPDLKEDHSFPVLAPLPAAEASSDSALNAAALDSELAAPQIWVAEETNSTQLLSSGETMRTGSLILAPGETDSRPDLFDELGLLTNGWTFDSESVSPASLVISLSQTSEDSDMAPDPSLEKRSSEPTSLEDLAVSEDQSVASGADKELEVQIVAVCQFGTENTSPSPELGETDPEHCTDLVSETELALDNFAAQERGIIETGAESVNVFDSCHSQSRPSDDSTSMKDQDCTRVGLDSKAPGQCTCSLFEILKHGTDLPTKSSSLLIDLTISHPIFYSKRALSQVSLNVMTSTNLKLRLTAPLNQPELRTNLPLTMGTRTNVLTLIYILYLVYLHQLHLKIVEWGIITLTPMFVSRASPVQSPLLLSRLRTPYSIEEDQAWS
jgi:hypothetical protein